MISHKLRAVLSPKFPSALIGNNALGQVVEPGYLRVILDPHIKFSPHTHSVTKKLANFIPICYRFRRVLNLDCF